MKNFIIITSIYSPNQVIEAFSRWKDWELIVVGDKKTPQDWQCEDVTFLNIEDQYKQFNPFAKLIPENTYTRKMIGYLYAIREGATAIFESDDDNIPYPSAEKVVNQLLTSTLLPKRVQSSSGWVNIYEKFGAPESWPRGFPIQHLQQESAIVSGEDWKVMQFLADKDPDVDAIYRMVKGTTIDFDKNKLFLLEKGTFCPFNSQATLWRKEAFPLLFFPLHVPDRVTDILRGYIALACLWKMGYTLGYHSPIVYQERNPHNLLNDFQQELALYTHADTWSKMLMKLQGDNAPALFSHALKLLADGGYISDKNNVAYSAFLKEMSSINPAIKKSHEPVTTI